MSSMVVNRILSEQIPLAACNSPFGTLYSTFTSEHLDGPFSSV